MAGWSLGQLESRPGSLKGFRACGEWIGDLRLAPAESARGEVRILRPGVKLTSCMASQGLRLLIMEQCFGDRKLLQACELLAKPIVSTQQAANAWLLEMLLHGAFRKPSGHSCSSREEQQKSMQNLSKGMQCNPDACRKQQ